jgi:hypothetical protein
MIGLFLRFLGLIALTAALAAVIMDAARSIAASGVRLTELQPLWLALSPESFAAFREFVQVRLAPSLGTWLWDPLTVSVLAGPVSVELVALGFALLLAGARRKRRAPPT